MRRTALLALSLAALAPSRAAAWRLFSEPSDGRIRPIQALADARRNAEVAAALTPQFLQTLRGTDLRQAYVLLGDSLAALGRPDGALSAYQLGAGLFPRNVDLLTRLADLLHAQGLDDRAKPSYLRAVEIEPRHFGAHLGLAEIDRDQGFLDRAAGHYEAALEALSSRAGLWRDYGQVLIALRDYSTAEAVLRKALELEPQNASAYVLLGFARRGLGDGPGALARLDQALGLGAGVGARRAKALWLVEAGRFDEARAQADLILAEAPGDGAALWALARADLAAGRRDRALARLASSSGQNAGFCARAARALSGAL